MPTFPMISAIEHDARAYAALSRVLAQPHEQDSWLTLQRVAERGISALVLSHIGTAAVTSTLADEKHAYTEILRFLFRTTGRDDQSIERIIHEIKEAAHVDPEQGEDQEGEDQE